MAAIMAQLADEQVRQIREAALAEAERFVAGDGTLRFPATLVVASARRPLTSAGTTPR
jgi:hypothetical protein